MSDNVNQLEHDVESARAKLTDSLSRLRAPSTYAEFTAELKEEALDAKDMLVEKAKAGAMSTLEDVVETVKAKAAANPIAALAIGAGIAWRLFQRPPIATALVGAGLLSLLRTAPAKTNGQTGDYLSHAKGRLAEQASEFAGNLKEEAVTVIEAVKDKAVVMTGAATERLGSVGDQVRSTVQHAASNGGAHAASIAGNALESFQDVREAAGDLSSRSSATLGAVAKPIEEALVDQEARDKVLLGFAGAAVVTALGIAYQRRRSEQVDAA